MSPRTHSSAEPEWSVIAIARNRALNRQGPQMEVYEDPTEDIQE